MQSVDPSLARLNYGSNNSDAVRDESGKPNARTDLPITIDPVCLSHMKPGVETSLALKLFKVACLAYKPSNINYRNRTLDQLAVIRLRQGLIDKVTNLVHSCELFRDKCIYPRRYFDDLMLDHTKVMESSVDQQS